MTVAIIAVAVPEGLPLAVSISLAYSVDKMEDEHILAKSLEAPEEMGSIEEICTGKTATLTKNEMQVTKFFICQSNFENKDMNTFVNSNLPEQAIELVKEGILFNCDSRIEMDDFACYKAVGNGTECGLINFLMQNNIECEEVIKQKTGRIAKVLPFDSTRKRMVTCLVHPTEEGLVRMYVKGAPELIFPNCSQYINLEGGASDMDDEMRRDWLNDTIINDYAKNKLRTFVLAYKDIKQETFTELFQETNGFTADESQEKLE